MGKLSYFAPPVRSSAEQILKENDLVKSQAFFTNLFGAMTGIAAVINRKRQIVYANSELLSMLGVNTIEPILGKRPGEVISCIHSDEEPYGCGTSKACAYCGAVNTILESQQAGVRVTKEAHISSVVDGKHKSWDLKVVSTPISFDGEAFSVLILQDISDEKRRAALERIFFHDLLNSVGGLNGLLTVLKQGANPEETKELINLSEEISRNVIEEILLQRQIRDAENGELLLKIEALNSLELLDSVINNITFHESGKEKSILVSDNPANIVFESDKVLLQRVIINLLKNALEATPIGGSVVAGIKNSENNITFWVKNDQVIPGEVQMQLFHRSFSTKGEGRGLGTYSIRLLTENYLEGKVSFISNENEGTVFYINLNKKFPVNLT